ncbi:uncharacterized protein LOC124207891 [Daphnia pulex]|uniref:uncharacterized protein LOC124207891 n=1 Tax=Daphnia pulex TaxID=6669 RepID=UPI001EE0BF75|nr:uncharacterized protein LOC124207891 [Daphnia pulex]
MKIHVNLQGSCYGFSLRTVTLVIGILSLAGNVRVFSYELQIGADMGTLSNFLVIIPMIISSALVVVVAMENRFPKLLIPWIVFSVLELFIVLFGCYLFMVAAGQAFQPKSIEKFFFITIGVLLLTVVILFRTWFVVFSYYHELMFGPKKYPQPDDLPLYYHYGLFNLSTVAVTR